MPTFDFNDESPAAWPLFLDAVERALERGDVVPFGPERPHIEAKATVERARLAERYAAQALAQQELEQLARTALRVGRAVRRAARRVMGV